MSTDNATVRHGTDAGDYYCEHMFFMAQNAASLPDASVLRNDRGEHMVGFLHVPGDSYRYQEPGTGGYTLAERHIGTREVVGAALRGYFAAVAPQVGEGSVKLMVTGYDRFGGTRNNPTAEFVQKQENLDAAMAEAFGDQLVTPIGTPLGEPDDFQGNYIYRVRDPASGAEREVILQAVCFPVDDTAIDGQGPRSIQGVIAASKPHSVLSMGVHGGRDYEAEFHADCGELSLDPPPGHDTSARAGLSLRDNFALAWAIYQVVNRGKPGGLLSFLRGHGDPP